VLTFRGTNPRDLQNWIVDLNYFRMIYPPANNDSVLVHEGFWQSYVSIIPDAPSVVRDAIFNFPSYKGLILYCVCCREIILLTDFFSCFHSNNSCCNWTFVGRSFCIVGDSGFISDESNSTRST
jgi:hypothetical protein